MLILAAVILVAALVRLFQLGTEGLWADETHLLLVAQRPLPDLLTGSLADNHPPLYYLITRLFDTLLGAGEWTARLPAAICGLITVWLTYRFGRRLFTPRVGLVAAALLATSPMAIHYSQEARSYSFLMLLTLLLFDLAHRLVHCNKPKIVVAAATVSILLLYSHYAGIYVIAGLTVAVAIVSARKPRRAIGWLTACAIAGAGFAPWIPGLVSQLKRTSASYGWAAQYWPAEFPWQVPRSLAAMTHGSLAPIRNRVADILPTAWIALLIVLLLVVAAFKVGRQIRSTRPVVFLATAVATPLVFAWIHSWISGNPTYVVGRVDSPVLPLFLLLTATGVQALRPRLQWLVLAGFVGLAIVPIEAHWRLDFRSQERLITEELVSKRQPGEVVITTYLHLGIQYYCSDLAAEGSHLVFPNAARVHPDWIDWSTYQDADIDREIESVLTSMLSTSKSMGSNRFWLFVRTSPRELELMYACDRRFALIGRRPFPQLGSELRCYALQIR